MVYQPLGTRMIRPEQLAKWCNSRFHKYKTDFKQIDIFLTKVFVPIQKQMPTNAISEQAKNLQLLLLLAASSLPCSLN